MDKYSLEAYKHYPEIRVCPRLKMPQENDRFGEKFREEGYGDCRLILRPTDEREIADNIKKNVSFGLLLDVCDGIVNLRENMARMGLQRVWEAAPVLLKTQGASLNTQELAHAAIGWHVAAADTHITGLIPARMALRRLTYPKNLSTGGAIPLRFWWQNVGHAPLYIHSEVKLKLRKGSTLAEININDAAPVRNLGDYTHNEIARLPELPAGEYELLCGLYDKNSNPLPIAIDAPRHEGDYIIGSVVLDDTPRPELFKAWDDYYPDGYYPTEDPKLPV